MDTAWVFKELTIIVLLCLLFGVIILFFLILITVNRTFGYLRGRNYKRNEMKWDRYFFPYLDGELQPITFPRIHKKEMLNWERYLYDYLKNIRGEEREHTVKLARHTGLISRLIRFLKKGNRWEKARAAKFLGSAGETAAARYLRQNLYSKDRVVFLAAARALAALGAVEYFHEIINVLLKRSNFTYEAISEVLVEFGEGSCPLIAETLQKNVLVTAYRTKLFSEDGMDLPAISKIYNDGLLDLRLTRKFPRDLDDSNVLCLYIDMLAAFNYLPVEPVLRGFLKVSDNEEVLIHCLKAVEHIGAPETAEDIAPLLSHPNWVIRSQAAKALGTINPDDYLEKLQALMSDQQWWVRFRAGEALLKSGEKGITLLKGLADCSHHCATMAESMLAMAKRS